METVNHPDPALVSTTNHVVDWQLVGTALAARDGTGDRDVRKRVTVLQARGKLLQAVLANPGTAATQQALAAVNAEIAGLLSQLAWRRDEARGNEHISASHTAEA